MKIGDRVIAARDIYEPPDEHGPGGFLARKGEILIVREVSTRKNATYAYHVSHETVLDNSFGVKHDEVYTEAPAHGDVKSLAYAVILEGWPHVSKVLREYKKKRNAGFHLEVSELSRDRYRVRIFKDKT